MFDFDFKFNFKFDGTKAHEKLKTFEEFCECSGYPAPYAHQIEAFLFSTKDGIKLYLGSRGYGKTDYITILGSAYKIYLNPHYQILIFTKEKERGGQLIGAIRQALLMNGVKLTGKPTSENTPIRVKGKIGKDPNAMALPIHASGIRGHHPDEIICDDITTPDDVSAAERRHVKRVYDEILKLCKKILLIGQPAHPLDIYAHIRNRVPCLLHPFGTIPQLDHDLDAQRVAGVDERSIQASYFLNIMQDDVMPFHKCPKADNFPTDGCVCYIDPSHKGGDYTTFSLGKMRNATDRIVFAGFAFKLAWYDCLDFLKQIDDELNINRVIVETNGLGLEPVRILREMGVPAIEHLSSTNKHGDILNASAKAQYIELFEYSGHNRDLKQANETYIIQTRQYEFGAEHDDAPDGLARWLISMGLIRNSKESKR